jgi:hypothetical protein
MRTVSKDMVVLENAKFSNGAQGYFSARAVCPKCGEERQITVPIWEQGKQWSGPAGCNKGHTWTVRASMIR